MLPRHLLARFRDRLAQSRFLTISIVLHAILIAFFSTAVIIDVQKEKGPMTASPAGLVQKVEKVAIIPPPPKPDVANFDPVKTAITSELSRVNTSDVVVPPLPPPSVTPSTTVVSTPITTPSTTPVTPSIPGLTTADKKNIGDTLKIWEGKGGEMFNFTAYIGRYQGNWNSTVRVTNGKITGGSLPNLLYAMSKWSRNKIRTNERNVEAIPLDSDELLVKRPPFIFLTGTRDFTLSPREIENLRQYIRCGGAIWGDSSVPGERSAFDNAFRREMQRVLPDGAQEFEKLPENHPVFSAAYYQKIKNLPSGINHYREPVSVLRWGGEIAVIQTRNDYGDMWQIGLDKDGKLDTSRNARGEYVAMNSTLWNQRGIYVRNIDQPAVEEAYQFGINMVMHLLTRWDRVAMNTPAL